MKKLTKGQFRAADKWIQANARPYDRAKWNYLFNGGRKDAIVEELLKYQNADGGMGNGFECDILSPLSSAISSAEAIFQAYEYGLNCNLSWFHRILTYFEQSVQTVPKYWEDIPREALDSPHAPWWRYEPCTAFSPNPCAVVASAFIRYGTASQQKLGKKIADDCLKLLLGNGFCGDHDTLNMQALTEQLISIGSPLVTNEVIKSMRRRIFENTCFDVSKYNSYYFTPLDFVTSPNSMWYSIFEHGIDEALDFWLENINEEGVWEPNFSWGINSDISRKVTKNWTGYITVKRAKILLNFGRME